MADSRHRSSSPRDRGRISFVPSGRFHRRTHPHACHSASRYSHFADGVPIFAASLAISGSGLTSPGVPHLRTGAVGLGFRTTSRSGRLLRCGSRRPGRSCCRLRSPGRGGYRSARDSPRPSRIASVGQPAKQWSNARPSSPRATESEFRRSPWLGHFADHLPGPAGLTFSPGGTGCSRQDRATCYDVDRKIRLCKPSRWLLPARGLFHGWSFHAPSHRRTAVRDPLVEPVPAPTSESSKLDGAGESPAVRKPPDLTWTAPE